MRVLTAESMREVDRRAIEGLGIPGLVLMENAAQGCVDALGERFPEAESATVLCGPGNNGGDGLAIARLLANRGYDLEIFLVRGPKPLQGDAAVQESICRRMGLVVTEVLEESRLPAVLAAARRSDVLIDALFGTGLSRPLGGHFGALVKALAEVPGQRLAVDLPSGLNGSDPAMAGPALAADLTVTFAAPRWPRCWSPPLL